MDLPEWAVLFCREHLGALPVELLHSSEHMSEVLGLRLDDGREVAVKARPDQEGREGTCVEVQRSLAQQGFPCAAPLTGVTVRKGTAIHAEVWRPGGEMLLGDDPATAVLFARLLARLVDLAAEIEIGGTEPGAVPPPLPNPEWVRWDHPGPGAWPSPHSSSRHRSSRQPPPSQPLSGQSASLRSPSGQQPPSQPLSGQSASLRSPFRQPPATDPLSGLAPSPHSPHHDQGGGSLPSGLEEAAFRLRERFAESRLPRVLGHVDWESQNLRWKGDQPWAVHDWDSLAWLPEAAIAGSACGAFASSGQPTLAPIASSAAFLDAYQAGRRPFSEEEIEIGWAASLWLALHNARAEVLRDLPPVALVAVAEQAEERLRLAGA